MQFWVFELRRNTAPKAMSPGPHAHVSSLIPGLVRISFLLLDPRFVFPRYAFQVQPTGIPKYNNNPDEKNGYIRASLGS